jgi:hypothetical protein
MNAEPKREYIGPVRIAGRPEIPLRLMASSLDEIPALVDEQYGEWHVTPIWNEEDAGRTR